MLCWTAQYTASFQKPTHTAGLRILKKLIIKKQHQVGRQTKATNFFSPVRHAISPSSDKTESGANGNFESFTLDTESMDQEKQVFSTM